MSRSSLAYAFLQKHPDVLHCPYCGQNIQADEQGIVCPEGHRVDFSRQGTLSLCSAAGDKRYNQALFAARRKVWQAGCFTPAAEIIRSMLPEDPIVTDLGCGEGSLLQALSGSLRYAVGVDLSAPAVKAASLYTGEDMLFIRGDLSHLPFQDNAFTALLNMLTPANYTEFKRILAPGGRFIKVIPGKNHLSELRQALSIPDGRSEDPEALFKAHCRNVLREEAQTTLVLPEDVMEALYAMTPMTAGYEKAEPKQITFHLTVLSGILK